MTYPKPLNAEDAIARLKRPNVGWIDGGKWAPVILEAFDAQARELATKDAAHKRLAGKSDRAMRVLEKENAEMGAELTRLRTALERVDEVLIGQEHHYRRESPLLGDMRFVCSTCCEYWPCAALSAMEPKEAGKCPPCPQCEPETYDG